MSGGGSLKRTEKHFVLRLETSKDDERVRDSSANTPRRILGTVANDVRLIAVAHFSESEVEHASDASRRSVVRPGPIRSP